MFIDDFELISKLDLHVRIHLDWLVKHGAASRIWVLSGLDLQKNPEGIEKINTFKTKIYGQVQSNGPSALNEFIPKSELAKLNSDQNFVTKIGSNWVHFWAPILQGK